MMAGPSASCKPPDRDVSMQPLELNTGPSATTQGGGPDCLKGDVIGRSSKFPPTSKPGAEILPIVRLGALDC